MLRLVTTFVAAAVLAEAVIVAPDSPCTTSCGNVLDATSTDDLVCSQDEYALQGNLFQKCVECELHSDYVGGGETDQQWMLCMWPPRDALFLSRQTMAHMVILTNVW